MSTSNFAAPYLQGMRDGLKVGLEEQATPAHRHSVPHEPATTFIRRLQPVLQDPVT